MSGKDKKLKVELKNYSHQAPVSEAKLPEGSVERMAPPQAPKLPPELEAKLKDIKPKRAKNHFSPRGWPDGLPRDVNTAVSAKTRGIVPTNKASS